jgi:hypothetical protein
MAGFTMGTKPEIFPAATVVKIYPASNWLTSDAPSGAPAGSSVAEKTVEASGVIPEFTGLTAGVDYYATASVGGAYRYVKFRIASPTAVTGERDEPEKALKNLLAALAAKGIITDETTQT